MSHTFAMPSIAGPSRHIFRPLLRLATPPIPRSCTALQRVPVARALSSSRAVSQSRRQAYTLAHPVDTPSGFEGVPAAVFVENTAAAAGKGKSKEVQSPTEGHGAPPPAPGATGAAIGADGKSRRKIQAKKAAITMTPTAVERLRALMSTPNPQLLRIGVKTRGCAGMAYHLDYVAPPGGKFDEVVEQDGVRVLIDSKALFSIIGSRMDWRDTRLSAGFVFDNPNVVDECGCGESFNIRF